MFFPSQFANIFLTYQTFVINLHLLRVELSCNVQEKLIQFHRVSGPFPVSVIDRVRSERGAEGEVGGDRNPEK